VGQLSAAVSESVVGSAATGIVGCAFALEHMEELAVSGVAEELSVIDSAGMSSAVGRFASSLSCRNPELP